SLELVMMVIADTFGVGPTQNIDNMPRSKTSPGFAHTPEETARIDGTILQSRLCALTITAIAAILSSIDFAKVNQQCATTTQATLAIGQHLLQLLARKKLLVFVLLHANPVLDLHLLTVAHEENTLRRLTVAACTPGLLVITFQVARQIIMDHRAHIRLGNAHAKGNRRHQHRHIIADKTLLMLYPLFGSQTGVIGQRANTIPHQFIANLIDGLTRLTINNHRLIRV